MKKLIYIIIFISSFCQAQIIDGFTPFATDTGSPFYPTSGLVGLYTETGITETVDGNDVTTWLDESGNSNDLVTIVTQEPTLHIGTNGNKQVRFDGIDQFLWASSNSIYNFIPQTDEFSIIVLLGDIVVNNAAAFLNKGNNTTGGKQYTLVGINDRVQTVVGGTSTTNFTSNIPQGNDLIIMTVSTTTVTVDWNGVERISGSIGTGTNTNKFAIGARGVSTPNSFVNCDIEQIYIYNRVLTAQEITDFETNLNVN